MMARTELETRRAGRRYRRGRATARGVVGVEGGEDEVAVREALMASLAGIDVTESRPIMMMFGGLAEHGTEGGWEGHADVNVDLDLVDAVHLYSTGSSTVMILRSACDVIEATVKGGGLARAGGAGDEEDAVGQGEEALEDFLIVREEAEFRETEHEAGFCPGYA